jgi:hypothetical protein
MGQRKTNRTDGRTCAFYFCSGSTRGSAPGKTVENTSVANSANLLDGHHSHIDNPRTLPLRDEIDSVRLMALALERTEKRDPYGWRSFPPLVVVSEKRRAVRKENRRDRAGIRNRKKAIRTWDLVTQSQEDRHVLSTDLEVVSIQPCIGTIAEKNREWRRKGFALVSRLILLSHF